MCQSKKIEHIMGPFDKKCQVSNEVSASDPGWSGGGGRARNMKYKGPPMAAIFFMTSFNRDGGGRHGPLGHPPWIRNWVCSSPVAKVVPELIVFGSHHGLII